jgi:hypothetical protein
VTTTPSVSPALAGIVSKMGDFKNLCLLKEIDGLTT